MIYYDVLCTNVFSFFYFFFQAEDGIRDRNVTGVQTCALPILIEGLVGGQLISSILAVSCVTVAFCSNFLMVQDKANGTIRDLRISPVKSATLSLSYYVATLLSTLIICFAATGICLTYVAIVGWYMSLADIFFLFLDILLLVLFGTALSSIINFF